MIVSLFLLALASSAHASQNPDEIRYHVQNLYNEMDVLIKNQKSDNADLKKQEREFERFRIFERITFSRDENGLKSSIEESAKDQKLTITSFKLLKSRPKHSAPVPASVFTDNRSFHLEESQVAETIPFSVTVQGSSEQIASWVQAWPAQVLRLVTPTSTPTPIANQEFRIEGIAYRFKTLRFPRLIPRDPITLVPRGRRAQLSKTDPSLWQLVRKTEELRPLTPKLYESRAEFLLDGARMEFLLRRLGGAR